MDKEMHEAIIKMKNKLQKQTELYLFFGNDYRLQYLFNNKYDNIIKYLYGVDYGNAMRGS